MMLNELSYEKAIANVAALKAIGQTRIHLWDGGTYPWHIAEKCEPGGSHRLDISTSVRFSGHEHGLEFVWSFDIEPREANGRSAYMIDVDACKGVLRKLKGDAREGFRKYLSECATKVKARGDEFQASADRQFKEAALLRDLVSYQPEPA